MGSKSGSPPIPCVTVGQPLHLSGPPFPWLRVEIIVPPSQGGLGVRSIKVLASAPLRKHWMVATVTVSSYFIQETEVRLTEPTSPGFSSFRRISGMGFVVRCFFSPQDNQDTEDVTFPTDLWFIPPEPDPKTRIQVQVAYVGSHPRKHW